MNNLAWIKLFFFLFFSLGLLWFTLHRPHAHRGYRFVAFECVLALIFLQVEHWFLDPLRATQVLSWILLTTSLYLAIAAYRLLSSQGAPAGDLEATTQLVTSGVYRWIRHPLYASLIYLGWGAALKQISLLSVSILLLLCIAVYLTARVEERTNLEQFGDAYREYMRRTKMFIPLVI
jgi:protein-S-isoprenylcysteine O-methyltransferase Ste14